jgi:Domain of unknown function (DUF1929)
MHRVRFLSVILALGLLFAWTRAATPAEGNWRPAGATGAPNTNDVAIHAALLRTSAEDAEILFFAGDGYDAPSTPAGQKPDFMHTSVFRIVNAAANQFRVEKIPSPPADLFCAGHAQLEDGRLLVAGGTTTFDAAGIHAAPMPPHILANRDSFVFDPKFNVWSPSFQMNFQPRPDFEPGTEGGGRWYPTLVTLNSGAVLAFWGHPQQTDTRHTNDTPEYFRPDLRTWQILGLESDVREQAGQTDKTLGYPRVHLLPNGRLFRATPVNSVNVAINPVLESLVDRSQISTRVSNAPSGEYLTGDTSYTSVLLPLTLANKYSARVLLTGRRQPLFVTLGSGDVGATLQSWQMTSQRPATIRDRMSPAPEAELCRGCRLHATATILPTGEIFVSGGKAGTNLARDQVLEGEIYNPFNDSWRVVASATVPREYHSVAVLMPDGRVWHAGTSKDQQTGPTNQEHRIELYEPWYFDLTRPIIRAMTGPGDPVYRGAPLMHPRGQFFAEVDHFRPVKKFVLIRAGSSTHAFNPDQRYIELESRLVETAQLIDPAGFRFTFAVMPPPSSSIAPPGNYLLFAIDDREVGVPSVGRFVRVTRRFGPDLVPDPFCKLDSAGRLVLTIRGQGETDAPASTTMVEFFPGGAFLLPTPPLAPGESVDLPPLSIPLGCYDPDCAFRITVDSSNQVDETNEDNNSVRGQCLG